MLVGKGNGQRIDLIVHVCYGRSPAVVTNRRQFYFRVTYTHRHITIVLVPT